MCGCNGSNGSGKFGPGGPGTAYGKPATPGTAAGITNPVPPTTASITPYANGARTFPQGPSNTRGTASTRTTRANTWSAGKTPARATKATGGPALAKKPPAMPSGQDIVGAAFIVIGIGLIAWTLGDILDF